mgnify:CR=1 FL=1
MENKGKNGSVTENSAAGEALRCPPNPPATIPASRANPDNQPENRDLLPRDEENRLIMPVTVGEKAIMRTFGFENILASVASGMTYSKIAGMIGVNPVSFGFFISNLPKDQREAVTRAKQCSDELIGDKAEEVM